MRDLTVDLLNELLEYDKETGDLLWKVRKAKRVKVGDIAGYIESTGYKRFTINAKSYLVHRIVFLMHKGYLPKTIDHINGDRLDNRIENLRAVTANQNQHNRKLNSNNTRLALKESAGKKHTKSWSASIRLEGKQINVGYFSKHQKKLM